MSYETIRVDREGAIATITIDRPERRNALNTRVRTEMIDLLDELREDETLRVVILTGAGEKAFVAGADLQEFAERSVDEQREQMDGPRVFDEIAAFPFPVIAMINGYALGGGCELAIACDLRIAGESARLGQPEINLGIIPGGGGTQRLPRLVGVGQAMRLIITGEVVDAEEALRIGLVDIVVPDDELRERVMEMARGIAEKSPVALRMAKSAVRASQEMTLSAGLGLETERFLTCFGSAEKEEGIAAFFEKRKPDFTRV